MTGTPLTPAVTGTGQPLTASVANANRIQYVTDWLKLALCSNRILNTELVQPFLSLARGIDYAVANNEVPLRASDLPLLLKQISQRRNDFLLLPTIMVLMVSVKNACKVGWFSVKDAEELISLVNEIGKSFYMAEDINTKPSDPIPFISSIMERFYPCMRMGQILAYQEIKPGYGAYLVDFHITKNAKFSQEDKIRLFVAQTDNVEKSSCLISPQQVNFLVNGKGVNRRVNMTMDSGPQIPSNVTAMLKYGTNLLQAIGQFNGHYVIALAFMSMISLPDTPLLQDYVQPMAASSNSDSEIIEGPSRISLNCPISYSRIKTPVKGHSCKHIQCFDFDNFVEINTRRPSWRCPHCNQYVCYLDIRIDQNMAKVLREAGENVSDVIISSDGSWKAVFESNDHVDQPQVSEQHDINSSSHALLNVLDLSEGEDDMNAVGIMEYEDRKPCEGELQCHVAGTTSTIQTELNNENELNQNTALQVEGDFWSGLYLSTHDSHMSSSRVGQIPGVVAQNSLGNNMMVTSVLSDAVSPQLTREPEGLHGTNLRNPLDGHHSSPDSLQLQQSQFSHPMVSNDYGSAPSLTNPLSSSAQYQVLAQDWVHRDLLVMPSQSGPQVLPPTATSQSPGAYCMSSALPTEHLQHNALHQRVYQSSNLSSGPVGTPVHVPRTQIQQVSTQNEVRSAASFRNDQAWNTLAVQQSAQIARQPQPGQNHTSRSKQSFSVRVDGFRASVGEQRGRVGGMVQQVQRAESLVDLTSEQNRQPRARMRGSLTGQAYSDALNQFMNQPIQPTQIPRPPSNLTSPPPGIPPQLQALIANNVNAHASASHIPN